MTEAEWLASFDPGPMLEFLKGKVSDRKFRLFSCACYRRIWHKLPEVSRQTVEVAERFVDGKATSVELRSARQLVMSQYGGSEWLAVRKAGESHPLGSEWLAVRKSSGYSARRAAYSAASKLSQIPDGGYAGEIFVAECKCQTIIVHEIFGNPLRPTPPVPASILAWNDGMVRRIAEVIYSERHLPDGTLDNTRLAILADALEEAGCTNADILDHCHQPGEHVRGCWVIDLILGKK